MIQSQRLRILAGLLVLAASCVALTVGARAEDPSKAPSPGGRRGEEQVNPTILEALDRREPLIRRAHIPFGRWHRLLALRQPYVCSPLGPDTMEVSQFATARLHGQRPELVIWCYESSWLAGLRHVLGVSDSSDRALRQVMAQFDQEAAEPVIWIPGRDGDSAIFWCGDGFLQDMLHHKTLTLSLTYEGSTPTRFRFDMRMLDVVFRDAEGRQLGFVPSGWAR